VTAGLYAIGVVLADFEAETRELLCDSTAGLALRLALSLEPA
jgi:hypothetical protein